MCTWSAVPLTAKHCESRSFAIPGEIRVELAFDFREYKVGAPFSGKDQVDENANKGLRHSCDPSGVDSMYWCTP
jgi:hypothetical protein